MRQDPSAKESPRRHESKRVHVLTCSSSHPTVLAIISSWCNECAEHFGAKVARIESQCLHVILPGVYACGGRPSSHQETRGSRKLPDHDRSTKRRPKTPSHVVCDAIGTPLCTPARPLHPTPSQLKSRKHNCDTVIRKSGGVGCDALLPRRRST
jgi:hypothetical protein